MHEDERECFVLFYFIIFIIIFLNTMSSTCFEPDSLSSGRQLYVQVLYVNILHHTVHTAVFLKINPWVRNM
jgi:hypothetical protein